MGQIIQIKCGQCNFQKEMYIGGGLKDCDQKTILAALSKDDRDTLLSAIRHGAVRISINRELSVCDYCGNIRAVPVVRYSLNGTEQELRSACPLCGEEKHMEWTMDREVTCPGCGGRLTRQQIGHWD